MATAGAALINQHPTNPIKDTFHTSSSSKSWTKSFPPITKLNVHDDLRLSELVNPPNYRQWRLNSEEDGINWFHTEISNVVLGVWTSYPQLLQASHEKPLSEHSHAETVDIAYSVSHGRVRTHIAIGEFKRCLIVPAQWQSGNLTTTQKSLSQELRGYAYKYACPHVFCFDNSHMLLLQFRAEKASDIKDANCEVDCWILPRQNSQGTPLRYALYRLLAQGFRRCQGLYAMDVSLNGIQPHRRYFYCREPVWKIDGKKYAMPWGHRRVLDRRYGAFYWTDAEGSQALLDEDGNVVWDTAAFWGAES